MQRRLNGIVLLALCVSLMSCAGSKKIKKVPQNIPSAIAALPQLERLAKLYNGPRLNVVVEDFVNRSYYLQGLFASNEDKLGNQAQTILGDLLQDSGYFSVQAPHNLAKDINPRSWIRLDKEIRGARYVVTGSVIEFSRRVAADRTHSQVSNLAKKEGVYVRVILNVTDTLTSKMVYATQGLGEYLTSPQQMAGFGTLRGYNAILNRHALKTAITNAINTMVRDLRSSIWRPKL